MEYIKPTYKIKNVDIRDLLFKFDFHRYNKDNLVHRFPVYKYNGRALVYGEFVIYDDSDVERDNNILHVHVVDSNGYPCAYNEEDYGRSTVTELINENVRKEIDKFIEEGLILTN